MNDEDFIGCHDGKGDDDICVGIRIGRKQGALEELVRFRNHLDVLPNRHFKEYLRSVIIKRIKELKECDKE